MVNAQATLELAQANEARMKALLAQEYVSKQEYDQARQALKAGQAQVALARAQNDATAPTSISPSSARR